MGEVLAAVLAGAAVAVASMGPDTGRLAAMVRGAPVGPGARAAPARGVGDGGVRSSPAPAGGAAGAGSRPALASPAGAACVLAGAALAVLVSAPVGMALGVVVAVAGPRLLGRLESRVAREQREQLLRDLPLVLDLLASCLAGGAALAAAAEAVSRAVPGPAGGRLGAVGAALAVGSPPGEAWAVLAGPDPGARRSDPWGPAARALSRAADGGAPVAAAVSRLAAEARADARSRAEQAARRVGVLAVAPLGLCFLPAFVLIGVVPVVVALAGPLLASF